MVKNVLVTGGAGYIGSHTCLALIHCGYNPIIVDNFSNSYRSVIDQLSMATFPSRPVTTYEADVRDQSSMEHILRVVNPIAVIHLAGLKAVGESVKSPLTYYEANVGGAVSVLQAMQNVGVTNKFVFSSTATVYGDVDVDFLEEDLPLSHANPYAHTKIIIEDMLRYHVRANPSWDCAILRYFNPIGAHPSGMIADQPLGTPMNLMPLIVQAAKGERELTIFGDDYPTPDGTCIRDYIHVCDLAAGHVAAVEHLLTKGSITCNLGTGTGYSVKQVIQAFETRTGVKVPHKIGDRRPGDVARLVANPKRANYKLNWYAQLSMLDMCLDAWNARSL